jgi:hypothetical protein
VSRDLAFGGLGLLLATGYYAMALSVPQSRLADAVGPDGLPKAYAVVLALLSAALIVSSGRAAASPDRGRTAAATPDDRSELPHAAAGRGRVRFDRAGGMLLAGAGYVAVASWLGYAASIGALILAATWCQGGAIGRRAFVIAVGGAVFFWLLFVVLLRIPYPAGIWAEIF